MFSAVAILTTQMPVMQPRSQRDIMEDSVLNSWALTARGFRNNTCAQQQQLTIGQLVYLFFMAEHLYASLYRKFLSNLQTMKRETIDRCV